MARNKRIIVGITGASGAPYAQRLIRLALDAGVELHLIASPLGKRLLQDELGIEGLDPAALSGREPRADGSVPGITCYHHRDVGAAISSGSFQHDGMVIAPCSANSLAAVAAGTASNLLHRAAQVALKERRTLVILHREMPLSLVEIRNMERVTEAGAVVAPAAPGFYLLPQSIDDLVDFVVGRVLDQLGIEHDLAIRWGESPAPSTEADVDGDGCD